MSRKNSSNNLFLYLLLIALGYAALPPNLQRHVRAIALGAWSNVQRTASEFKTEQSPDTPFCSELGPYYLPETIEAIRGEGRCQ